MNALKGILVAFAVGLLAGAGIVLLALYRPASATIVELRRESERLSGQHRTELDGYSKLLKDTRGRIAELEEDLRRAETEYRAAIDGTVRAENQARNVQELANQIQKSGGRALELNRSIRTEAETAYGQLRGLRRLMEQNTTSSRKRNPDAED